MRLPVNPLKLTCTACFHILNIRFIVHLSKPHSRLSAPVLVLSFVLQVTDQIYANTTTITSYKIASDFPDVDTSKLGEQRIVSQGEGGCSSSDLETTAKDHGRTRQSMDEVTRRSVCWCRRAVTAARAW